MIGDSKIKFNNNTNVSETQEKSEHVINIHFFFTHFEKQITSPEFAKIIILSILANSTNPATTPSAKQIENVDDILNEISKNNILTLELIEAITLTILDSLTGNAITPELVHEITLSLINASKHSLIDLKTAIAIARAFKDVATDTVISPEIVDAIIESCLGNATTDTITKQEKPGPIIESYLEDVPETKATGLNTLPQKLY